MDHGNGRTAIEHAAQGIRFGRTLVAVRSGNPTDQGVDIIACAANTRGVMGVGVAGAVRLAGGLEIEREIMSQAPLTIGTAYLTGAGALASTGVRHVIHAVVADALGAPSREDSVRRATSAMLWAANRAGARSLLVPPLGAGLGAGALNANRVWLLIIEELIAHIRRFRPRLERVILLCRDGREAQETAQALREARVLWSDQPGGLERC